MMRGHAAGARPMPGIGVCRAPRGMRGQALVLFVTLLGVLCLGVLLLFNTGQVVNRKVRLTNAVDAAAYSVAAEEARKLNFAAYMNRGRVANEVAVAQMVSIWSYYNFVQNHVEMHREISQWLAMIPIINFIAAPINAAYTGLDVGLDAARPGIKQAVTQGVRVLDEVDGYLAEAADTMIAYSADDAGQRDVVALAEAVLERNDPHAGLSASAGNVLVGQLQAAHDEYIQRFRLPRSGTNPDMDRYRNVVMESRDYFSRDRKSTFPLIPETTIGPTTFGLAVEGRGGTDMVDYDRWAGLDAMSLVPKIETRTEVCVLGICTPDVVIDTSPPDMPFGGGGAQAVEQNRGQRFDDYRNGRGFNSALNYEGRHYAPYSDVDSLDLAAFWARNLPVPKDHPRSEAYLPEYEGLRDYDDIAPGKAMTPNDGPVFTVYASSGEDSVRTSENIDGMGGPPGSTVSLEGSEAGDRYTALASAQVYFHRPMALSQFKRTLLGRKRQDKGLRDVGESGSLFSPFWQARLVETDPATRARLGVHAP